MPLPYGLQSFCWKNLPILLSGFSCILFLFPSFFQYFLFVFDFVQFDLYVSGCSSLGLFEMVLMLLGFEWGIPFPNMGKESLTHASWIWVRDSFPMLGSFQLLSFQIFSLALSLSILLLAPRNMDVGVYNIVPEFLDCLHFFSIFFLCSMSVISTSLSSPSHLLLLLPPVFCCWLLLVNFLLLYFAFLLA